MCGPWDVEVTESGVTVTGPYDPHKDSASGNTVEYTLTNIRVYDLPSAGGPGTYLFTISGVAMLFTALLLWIKPNRKEAWTEE